MNSLVIWNSILSDLFVNLSAGWFGAVLIVPNFTKETGYRRLWMLTANGVLGILSLLLAFKLRNL